MTGRRRLRGRSGRGAATLLVVAMSGVLLAVGAGATAATALVVDHRRAQSAADLAALAGARAALEGGDVCAIAASTATRNGARLRSCREGAALGALEGAGTVEVVVDVLGPRWWGRSPVLSARARAGGSPEAGVAHGSGDGPTRHGPGRHHRGGVPSTVRVSPDER